jgi:hypothetical protein
VAFVEKGASMGKQLHADDIEAPEIKQALAKVEEYAKLASSARTIEDRDQYDRMSRKWLAIAESWRVIVEIDNAR